MSLNKIKIKPYYNSKKDDVLNEFYIPSLSKAKTYKRVSAYFDSNILNLYSKGIEYIYSNNGHIYFIFSNSITEKDFNLIKDGYANREEINQGLLSSFDDNNSGIDISNLAFLIEKNVVDIKIAFTKENGIFHDKFGLIEDGNDIIYFRGSNNETVASVKSNYESFETSLSWNSDENEKNKIKNAEVTFENLWNNIDLEGIVVVDIPLVLKEHILKHNQGKLVISFEHKTNSFVLDIKDGYLLGINQLDNSNLLNPITSFYKNKLSHYIEYVSKEYFYFKKDLDYSKIKNIISNISKYSSKGNFELFITPNLNKYLYESDLLLDKRKSLGIAIKRRLSYLNKDIDKFESILSTEMVRELRKPQLWDAFHIALMKRSANFSVPGSGKTSIVLGAYAYLSSSEINEIDQILVIGPISSFMSWKNEFIECFGSKKKLICFDYQEQKNSSRSLKYDEIVYGAKEANLVLINYESLKNNVFALKSMITSKTMIVFDEVHRIKSIEGIRAQFSKDISNISKYRVVLTGTPIPNGYLDIYNLFNILYSEDYNNYFGFSPRYLKSADKDYLSQNTINKKIYPFFCRTTKKELNVPAPEPDNLTLGFVEATEKENKLIELIYQKFNDNFLTLFIRLIQASSNPKLLLKNLNTSDLEMFNSEYGVAELNATNIRKKSMFSENDKLFINSFDYTGKFKRGIELIKELSNNGPVIVWAIFIDTLVSIKKSLDNINISSRVVYGNTSFEDRNKIITGFQNNEFQVLITNPHTLGESVSLHRVCHQAIYFELSFNLVHLLQSRDRIHRLGLNEADKTYYYFLTLNSKNAIFKPLDRIIYNRLKEKELLQQKAVENNEFIIDDENIIDDINMIFSRLKK